MGGQESTIYQLFDSLQIAGLACLICLCIGRGAMLYSQGVRVVVTDKEQSMTQILVDFLLISLILLWGATVFFYAWFIQAPASALGLSVVLFDNIGIKAAGAVVSAAGLVIYVWALRSFGQWWRIGLDRQKPGKLVTAGVFSRTRNPIYLSLEFFIIGTCLMEGRAIQFVLTLLIVVMIHILILREERFLKGKYGEAYREYCERVQRYVNWRSLLS